MEWGDGGGAEREREKRECVSKTCNLGMSPDQGLNPQPFAVWDHTTLQLTEPPNRGCCGLLK